MWVLPDRSSETTQFHLRGSRSDDALRPTHFIDPTGSAEWSLGMGAAGSGRVCGLPRVLAGEPIQLEGRPPRAPHFWTKGAPQAPSRAK